MTRSPKGRGLAPRPLLFNSSQDNKGIQMDSKELFDGFDQAKRATEPRAYQPLVPGVAASPAALVSMP